MKKIISTVLAGAMAASLLAGSAVTCSAADTTLLYHCYNTAPYTTLDPSIEYSNGIMTLQNVYETLTRYNDETEEVEPLLAESWEYSEDGKSCTFKLREDVTFHDGAVMNADAVVASINRTMEIGQGASYNWDPVESVEATGEYEVTFTCSYAAPIDLIASAGYSAYIMSPNVIDKDAEWFNEGNDGGSGPYMIAKATGDSVVLTAYPDYRGGWEDGQYQNVLIKEVAESSARRQLLETGESQLTSELSSTDLKAMEENDSVSVERMQTFNNILIFFNTESAPCDNADFRRALAYAFPYEETIEGVLDGNAAASYGLVPAGLWGHDESILQYTCDLDKAQEYLDKSGVDVSGVTLNVTYMNGYDEYANFLQMYQSNLKKLGISLELRSMEWDEQWAEAQSPNADERQDMTIMIWWPDYASPESWFKSLVYGEDEIVYNLSYIDDEEIDGWIDEAVECTATDRDHAAELYVKVQEKVADEAEIITLYDQTRSYVISNTITGVHENPAYSTVIPYYNVRAAQ